MRANLEKDAEVLSMDGPARSRFWDRAQTAGDCWPWQSGLYNGYGRFAVGRRSVGAHRAAYLLSHGALKPDEFVDHICRNRACVNPSHLRAATARENALEHSLSVTAGNAEKTHCPAGHEYTPENLRPHSLSKGWRDCLQCKRVVDRDRKRVRRALGEKI